MTYTYPKVRKIDNLWIKECLGDHLCTASHVFCSLFDDNICSNPYHSRRLSKTFDCITKIFLHLRGKWTIAKQFSLGAAARAISKENNFSTTGFALSTIDVFTGYLLLYKASYLNRRPAVTRNILLINRTFVFKLSNSSAFQRLEYTIHMNIKQRKQKKLRTSATLWAVWTRKAQRCTNIEV